MSLVSETRRYLGCGSKSPDLRTEELIAECLIELEEQITAKLVFRRFPLHFESAETVCAAGITVTSKNLGKNLRGCDEVIFLAATLGLAADRLLKKYSRLQISKAVVFHAAAAAFLEDYCDNWQRDLAVDLSREGLFLQPRFSPGYGDFSLEHQVELLNVLNAHKTIGLVTTDSSMLLPEKSITAVLGISSENKQCHSQACECCAKTDCEYRRG